MTLAEAEAAVAAYRARHPDIIATWELLNRQAIKELMLEQLSEYCLADTGSTTWFKDVWDHHTAQHSAFDAVASGTKVHTALVDEHNDKRLLPTDALLGFGQKDLLSFSERPSIRKLNVLRTTKPPKNKPHYRQMTRKRW